jgi:hypothetical protein
MQGTTTLIYLKLQLNYNVLPNSKKLQLTLQTFTWSPLLLGFFIKSDGSFKI